MRAKWAKLPRERSLKMLEVRCPYLPQNHYTAKGSTVDKVVMDLAMHWYQNHRNDPKEKLSGVMGDEPVQEGSTPTT
jgi:hypothetical protein